jgi:hypothetical protein
MTRLYVYVEAQGNTTFVEWTGAAAARSVGPMLAGARTPEELDSLLEDAFVLRDRAVFGALFEEGAVLAEGRGLEAHGGEAIGRALVELWARGRTYVACPRRVLRSRDTALVVADAGIHVLRRGGDGAWRAAISLLETEKAIRSEDA